MRLVFSFPVTKFFSIVLVAAKTFNECVFPIRSVTCKSMLMNTDESFFVLLFVAKTKSSFFLSICKFRSSHNSNFYYEKLSSVSGIFFAILQNCSWQYWLQPFTQTPALVMKKKQGESCICKNLRTVSVTH